MKAIVFRYLFGFSLLMALPLAFLAPPSSAGIAQADRWQELNPDHKPPARYGHSMVVLNGAVYLFGGIVSGQYTSSNAPSSGPSNDLWKFDPAVDDWFLVNPVNSPPPARAFHTAVASNGKMYIFFGLGGGNTALSDVWSYDPTTNSWQQEIPTSSEQPAARYHHSTTATNNGLIYVFGGVGSNGSVIDDYHMWRYDPSARTWEKKKAAPVVYYGQSMAIPATGEKVYMFGGFSSTTSSNDIWTYSPEQDAWEKLTPAGNLPPPKAYYGAAFLGDYWWIFGGQSWWLFGNRRERSYLGNSLTLPDVALEFLAPTESSDTWKYNFATNTWEQGTNAPIDAILMKAVPISGLSGRALGTPQLLTFGGISGGDPIDRTFIYTLLFRVWLPYISRGAAPVTASHRDNCLYQSVESH